MSHCPEPRLTILLGLPAEAAGPHSFLWQPFGHKTLLDHKVDWFRRLNPGADIILWPSDSVGLHALQNWAKVQDVTVYYCAHDPGLAPLVDFLGRRGADTILRQTIDTALVPVTLFARAIAHMQRHGLDYLSTPDTPAFPRGVEFELILMAALRAMATGTQRGDGEKIQTISAHTDKPLFTDIMHAEPNENAPNLDWRPSVMSPSEIDHFWSLQTTRPDLSVAELIAHSGQP